MQLNAITRKSALMALLLLIAILVAVAIRHSIAPFAIEEIGCERSLFRYILGFIIFFAGGIVEGKILPRTGLSNGFSTLPIPLYGVVACGIFVSHDVMIASSASFSLALAIFLLLRSLQSAGEKDSIFFAALLLGALPLIYPPSIVLAAVLPLSIFLLALSLRQVALIIIGYLLPFFAISYVSWYTGEQFWSFGQKLLDTILTPQTEHIFSIPYIAITMVITIVAILIWGAVYAVTHPNSTTRLSKERSSLNLFIWLTAITLAMFLIPSCNITAISLIAVPVAILLSFILGVLPNNHSTIAYWVLLALFALHLFIE